MDFEKAQELTELEGKVSLILVKIKDPCEVIETRDLLQEKFGVEFEVLAPKIEAQQNIQSQLAGFQLGLNIQSIVSLFVCGFLVFNTMFMAVGKNETYCGRAREQFNQPKSLEWFEYLYNEMKKREQQPTKIG